MEIASEWIHLRLICLSLFVPCALVSLYQLWITCQHWKDVAIGKRRSHVVCLIGVVVTILYCSDFTVLGVFPYVLSKFCATILMWCQVMNVALLLHCHFALHFKTAKLNAHEELPPWMDRALQVPPMLTVLFGWAETIVLEVVDANFYHVITLVPGLVTITWIIVLDAYGAYLVYKIIVPQVKQNLADQSTAYALFAVRLRRFHVLFLAFAGVYWIYNLVALIQCIQQGDQLVKRWSAKEFPGMAATVIPCMMLAWAMFTWWMWFAGPKEEEVSTKASTQEGMGVSNSGHHGRSPSSQASLHASLHASSHASSHASMGSAQNLFLLPSVDTLDVNNGSPTAEIGLKFSSNPLQDASTNLVQESSDQVAAE